MCEDNVDTVPPEETYARDEETALNDWDGDLVDKGVRMCHYTESHIEKRNRRIVKS